MGISTYCIPRVRSHWNFLSLPDNLKLRSPPYYDLQISSIPHDVVTSQEKFWEFDRFKIVVSLQLATHFRQTKRNFCSFNHMDLILWRRVTISLAVIILKKPWKCFMWPGLLQTADCSNALVVHESLRCMIDVRFDVGLSNIKYCFMCRAHWCSHHAFYLGRSYFSSTHLSSYGSLLSE